MGSGGAGGAGAQDGGGAGGSSGILGIGGAPDRMGVIDLPLGGDAPCLDRPAVCDPSDEPQQAAAGYLSSLADKCGIWYCNVDTQVTFDAQGCAVKMTAPGTDEAIQCLKAALEAERWLCATGMTVIVNVICE